MHKLVLIRHGESTWNLANRFTGWTDVPLTETGVAQARQGGKLLKEAGYDFDLAYTSVLQRAIWTLWHALDTLEHGVMKSIAQERSRSQRRILAEFRKLAPGAMRE